MYHFRTKAYKQPQEGRTEANLPPPAVSRTLSVPHSSAVPGLSHVMFVSTPNATALVRSSKTMPDQDDDTTEIKRNSSGGLLFRRKRSAQEQEEISRARAQVMSALYEQSDCKEEDLNKKASIKHTFTGAPKLSAHMMSAKDAIAAYQQQQLQEKKTADPLLTDRERKEQSHCEEIERRKAAIEARKSPISQLSRPPFSQNQFGESDNKAPYAVNKPRNWQRQEMERAKTSCKNMVESEGMEVVAPVSPTANSVAPTEASTPSPRGYHASNGMVYHVPNMC